MKNFNDISDDYGHSRVFKPEHIPVDQEDDYANWDEYGDFRDKHLGRNDIDEITSNRRHEPKRRKVAAWRLIERYKDEQRLKRQMDDLWEH